MYASIVPAHSRTSVRKKNVKILWHVNMQADHLITNRRPDIAVVHVDKDDDRALLLDIAVCPTRVNEKEEEKPSKPGTNY